MRDIYAEIVDLQRRGQPAVVVTVVAAQGHTPAEVQGKMLVDASGRLAGTVGGGALELRAIARAQAALAGGEPLLEVFHLDDREHAEGEGTGMICGGRVTLFFELIVTATPAYVFGAGHVGRALAAVLDPLGFAVTLIDSRPEQLADLDGPHMPAGPDYATIPDLPRLAASYVVIATHGHVGDEQVLAELLSRDERPAYLGVVASRRKSDRMLASVGERLGLHADDLAWISAPIGLHLGGNSPAAVALSIAAEMQAHRHGITGHARMRDRKKPGPTLLDQGDARP